MRIIILAVALMAGLTTSGYANTSYSTGSTTDVNSNPVNATAILSLSQVGATEVLTVILENFSPNQVSDGENITGLTLNINSSQITGVTLASSSADLIDVTSKTTSPTDLGTVR